MLIEKVPFDKYDGYTDPKVLFEEPVPHHFCSNALATPVLHVPCNSNDLFLHQRYRIRCGGISIIVIHGDDDDDDD